MRLLLIGCALLALASCDKPSGSPSSRSSAGAPVAPVAGVDRSHRGQPPLKASFDDPDGNETSLAAFAGKPTLVNLWASWCAPCVKELPVLDRLARARDGKLNVIAISEDMGPQASVEAFLQEHKIQTLEAYHDPKMALSGALGPNTVLPTTILYDARGREVWRYVGGQDWTSAQAARLLGEGGVASAQ